MARRDVIHVEQGRVRTILRVRLVAPTTTTLWTWVSLSVAGGVAFSVSPVVVSALLVMIAQVVNGAVRRVRAPRQYIYRLAIAPSSSVSTTLATTAFAHAETSCSSNEPGAAAVDLPHRRRPRAPSSSTATDPTTAARSCQLGSLKGKNCYGLWNGARSIGEDTPLVSDDCKSKRLNDECEGVCGPPSQSIGKILSRCADCVPTSGPSTAQ